MAFYVYSDNRENVAELVGFGKSHGKDVVVIAAESQIGQLSTLGADKVLSIQGVSSPDYAVQGLSTYLVGAGMELLLVGATARGREFAARIASLMELPMASDVNEVSLEADGVETIRMKYGGRITLREKLSYPCVVTIGRGHFARTEGVSPIEVLSLTPDSGVCLRSARTLEKEGVDLSAAKRIVSVGMGLPSAEDLEMARETSRALGGELACSRGVAEERKWLPISRFVGISGNVVSPDLYLAAGISGQIQHIFGVKEATIIVGINNNEKAPIFAAADYGIIGDMYEILPILTQKLKTRAK